MRASTPAQSVVKGFLPGGAGSIAGAAFVDFERLRLPEAGSRIPTNGARLGGRNPHPHPQVRKYRSYLVVSVWSGRFQSRAA